MMNMEKRMKSFKLTKLVFIFLTLSVFVACGGNNEKTGKLEKSKANVNINKRDEFGRTPLHYAALRGGKEEVQRLLEIGADVNAKDNYLFSPLHYAAKRGHGEVVRLLLAKKAVLNSEDHYLCTPLHHAAVKGHREIAAMLMDAGADLNAKDKNGQRPAELAYEEGHLTLANALNPLTATIKSGDLEYLKTLIERNPQQLNATDWTGRTPLHHAYHFEQKAIVDYLKIKGAKPNIKDKHGNMPDHYSARKKKKRTGFNRLDAIFAAEVDNIVYDMLHKYFYINVGLVYDGEVVFTRSYGNNAVNKDYVYASVSKFVTAIIVMQLVVEGKIENLDDNIWKYSPRYKNCMPEKYADSPLTIKHLLSFKSGVPHNNEPTWKNGKLNLKFKPGTDTLYTTPGFGILGHVIEGATGMSFDRAVKTYIGKPVGVSSFWVEKVFKAPGARVHSSIYDMARFVAGVINFEYFSSDIFYNSFLRDHSKGIGYPCRNLDTPDIMLGASGSNGYPHAHLVFKPKKKLGVVLLARTKDRYSFELDQLGFQLLALLESQGKSKHPVLALKPSNQ
jgi:ankyrin repeat protein